MTDNLNIAIREARAWASLPNRGGTVYIYRLRTGMYYCSQATPHEINAEYIATVKPDQSARATGGTPDSDVA